MLVGGLALGVAGSAAVFSVVDDLFLRPFHELDRLVALDERGAPGGGGSPAQRRGPAPRSAQRARLQLCDGEAK
jgi:hypothetical protein